MGEKSHQKCPYDFDLLEFSHIFDHAENLSKGPLYKDVIKVFDEKSQENIQTNVQLAVSTK